MHDPTLPTDSGTGRTIDRGEIPPDIAEWLDEQGLSLTSLARFERYRREHLTTYTTLLTWVQRSDTHRRLLRFLVEHYTGTTYKTLFEEFDASERHLRSLVGELRDEDVLVTEGNPATIRFASDEARILATDVAYFV